MTKHGFKHEEGQPLDTVTEYQRRRSLATKRAGPFLASTVFCAIALIVLYNVEISTPMLKVNLFVILLFGAFTSWGLHLYFETKYNRCPNCEHIPMDSRGQVDFNPAVCPKCGARLREYSSLL
jgi:hypothetical protein